jgi:hypothetical protein
VPQTQADLADAPEQITDPVDQSMSSAVTPEQTIVIPPQGKVSIIKLLLVDLCTNTIVTLSIFN